MHLCLSTTNTISSHHHRRGLHPPLAPPELPGLSNNRLLCNSRQQRARRGPLCVSRPCLSVCQSVCLSVCLSRDQSVKSAARACAAAARRSDLCPVARRLRSLRASGQASWRFWWCAVQQAPATKGARLQAGCPGAGSSMRRRSNGRCCPAKSSAGGRRSLRGNASSALRTRMACISRCASRPPRRHAVARLLAADEPAAAVGTWAA